MPIIRLTNGSHSIILRHGLNRVVLRQVGRRGLPGERGPSGAVESIVAGTNVTVDDTDPANPIVNATGGGGGGAVDSVNGQTGVVVLDADDISDISTTHRFTTAADITRLAGTSGTNTGDQTLVSLGLTATATELNFTDGVTSSIQTQVDSKQASDSDLTAIAALSPSNDDLIQRKSGAWTNRTPSQVKTDLSLTKSDVGLSNVDNTSDASKPVSTAQAVAIAVVQSDIDAHEANTSNPHSVTKTQVGLGSADNTSDANKPISTATQTALDLKQSLSEKGNANGYASLDGGGKVPVSQLPASLMEYKGVWNASTNSPTLADGSGDTGDVYRVGTAGTQNLGSGSISFDIGDYVIYNGSIWQKSDTTDAVATVFGRTGNVVATSGDYTASQVTSVPAGSVAATTVQAAIDELDTEKQPLDSDLTTIAGLTATTDSIIQSKSSAWTTRTPAQFKTDLVLVKGDVGLGSVDNTSDANKPVSSAQQTAIDGKVADAINDGTTTIAPSQNAVFDALALKQPLDSDLTTIAGLTATTDNFMVAASSAWASRTPAQAKTSLALTKTDVGLSNVDNTSDTAKPVSTAQQTALDLKANLASPTFTGTPAAPTAAAATNTTQIATTAHVFAERSNSVTLTNKTLTSPVINTPTGIVKGDVGLGNVDNTSNATERAATATLTNKRITKRTGTTTSSATPTINTDNVDYFSITALAVDITSFTTNLSGTPTTGQTLWLAITGTATRGVTWGATFESSTVTLPTTTSGTNRLDVGFIWNEVTSKWRCIAAA